MRLAKKFAAALMLVSVVSLAAAVISPRTASGGPTVSGTVSAQQSGPWTVGLTNGNIVLVGNPAGNPVLVRNVDMVNEPVQVPFQIDLCSEIGSACASPDSFLVPSDRRLIVEYVSGTCVTNPLANNRFEIHLFTVAGGTPPVNHSFHAVQESSAPDGPFFLFDVTQPTRIYADPGSYVQLSLSFGPGTGACTLALSGFTVAS